MPAAPPYIVQEAFLAPTSEIVRRAEIYENDGVMPWRPQLWDRLVDGTVSADASQDVRRSLDITLDNYDDELAHRPTNLWYDKVIKVFYGIRVDQQKRQPGIVIIEEEGSSVAGQSVHLKRLLNRSGFTRVRISTQVTTLLQIFDYDIVVSISEDYTRKLSLLTQAFEAGKSVLTCNLNSTAVQLPYIIATANATTDSIADNEILRSASAAHPVNQGWNHWAVTGNKTYRRINSLASGAVSVAAFYNPANGNMTSGIIARQSGHGSRWVHIQQAHFSSDYLPDDGEVAGFLASAMKWLDTFEPVEYWETQIGEFMIDSIDDNDQGDLIYIKGRDYAKRCMLSKFVNATGYAQGSNIGTIVRGIAANAGITKFNFPPVSVTLPRNLVYERGTERWKAMKDICDSVNYDLFFDSRGFLVMSPFNDPLTTPPTLRLTSGQWGNLVSASNKANDSRLFNHVIVVGESGDSNIPPVAAEARNILASSPSSIQRIGSRVLEIKSNLVTTVPQAQTLANNHLRISSLEEFELDFSSILLPWIEPGEILEIEERRDNQWQPTRYLLSSLSLPLDLGPMSGNGKRVTIVL